MKHKSFTILVLATLAALGASGCTAAKHGAGVGAGAAAGAAGGYLLGDKKPENVAIGAVAGAVVGGTVSALMANKAGQEKGYQEGLNDGYVLGDSDAAKRLYFAKRALEERTAEQPGANTRMSYYIWEEQGTTPDGRKLAPDKVGVPVVEALPVR